MRDGNGNHGGTALWSLRYNLVTLLNSKQVLFRKAPHHTFID
jgi:hypothetical protein